MTIPYQPAVPTDPLSALAQMGFEIQSLSHAIPILYGAFPQAVIDIANVLSRLRLPITEIIGSGGGETKFTRRMGDALRGSGWFKHNFVIRKTIDGVPSESTTHEIDHVKRFENGVIGCEIEWNNKDPFFDRDLENFNRLHAERVISVGIIITRGAGLQSSLENFVRQFAYHRGLNSLDALRNAGIKPTDAHIKTIRARVERDLNPISFADAWANCFVGSKYGAATTHWEKLQARVARGVGHPCPLLHIGLPASIVELDQNPVEQEPEPDPDTPSLAP